MTRASTSREARCVSARTVNEDGFEEGAKALAWLAARPQTAHFISYKLAQRFVADDPPPALVDRMAQTFLASDGDIKEVLRTMEGSPEFWSRKYYRTKVKTPLEFVASAFRATGTNPSNPGAIVNTLKTMGEPLYQMQPPTGYPMTADHWMNSAALIDRLNFSLALTGGKLGGISFDAPRLLAAGLLDRPSEARQFLYAPILGEGNCARRRCGRTRRPGRGSFVDGRADGSGEMTFLPRRTRSF